MFAPLPARATTALLVASLALAGLALASVTTPVVSGEDIVGPWWPPHPVSCGNTLDASVSLDGETVASITNACLP